MMNGSIFYKWLFVTYDFLWKLAVPLLKTFPRIREGFRQRTFQEKTGRNSHIWIQAASAGEAYLASQILKRLAPESRTAVHLTSYTSQGLQILEDAARKAEKRSPLISATTGFFPFDAPQIAKKAVQTINPRILVLLESEIWPGVMNAVKEQDGKILVINGRITLKSFRKQKLIPGLWRRIKPDHILAISPKDALRFSKLFDLDAVETMPNIKFDRMSLKDSAEPAAPFTNPSFIVMASVRKEEELQVCQMIRLILERRAETVIGLFPRHMHRLDAWKKHLKSMGIPWRLKSETHGNLPRGSVVLWDRFGELDSAYTKAASAFVGGSLANLGGQNFLEPLCRGIIPVIGPHWEDFSWVGQEIIDRELVIQAGSWQEAAEHLIRIMDKPMPKKEVAESARQYFSTRRGGAAQACDLIQKSLSIPPCGKRNKV